MPRHQTLLRVLTEIETALSRWQHTLLHGGPAEIDECTRALASLSGEAETLLPLPEGATGAAAAVGVQTPSSAALKVLYQARVFLATLRRARRVREAHSQALAGCSRLYLPAAAAAPPKAVL